MQTAPAVAAERQSVEYAKDQRDSNIEKEDTGFFIKHVIFYRKKEKVGFEYEKPQITSQQKDVSSTKGLASRLEQSIAFVNTGGLPILVAFPIPGGLSTPSGWVFW